MEKPGAKNLCKLKNPEQKVVKFEKSAAKIFINGKIRTQSPRQDMGGHR